MKFWKNNRRLISKLNFQNGNEVVVAGMVNNIRMCGTVAFLILQDISGRIQVFIKNFKNKNLKIGSVVVVKGVLKNKEKKNKEDVFGEWEIIKSDICILSLAKKDLPFEVNKNFNKVNESIRLKYRYLDLRGEIKNNLIFKSNIKKSIVDFLDKQNFVDINTPTLSFPTLEGANTFKVEISEKNLKFELSQSPQIYKQLLMIGGLEKYYQFANSYRLEDLRSNRQYEFMQLDIEVSYKNQTYLFDLIEKMFLKIFKEFLKHELTAPFQQITFKDAIELYGTDKPDLRFELKIQNFSFDNLENILTYGIFINQKVDINELMNSSEFNLRWAYNFNENIEGNFDEKDRLFLKNFFKSNKGTLLFLTFEKNKKNINLFYLGKVRLFLGKKFNLIQQKFCFAWIVNWPLFLYNEKENKWCVSHHLFTKRNSNNENIDLKNDISTGYDLVLNGCEIASGSERITDSQTQKEMFKISGLNEQQINENFSWFLEAMDYGVPPHMGIAIGFDRLIQLLLKQENIREVIAFPKNNHGICTMSNKK